MGDEPQSKIFDGTGRFTLRTSVLGDINQETSPNMTLIDTNVTFRNGDIFGVNQN